MTEYADRIPLRQVPLRTEPAPKDGEALAEQIDMGDKQITLVTAWMPLSWAYYEDYAHLLPQGVRAALDAHRGHEVAYKDSALGWRSAHCTDCDREIWNVHRPADAG